MAAPVVSSNRWRGGYFEIGDEIVEPGERIAGLERDVNRLIHDLYGNGQPGFFVEAHEFFTRADERAKAEMEFHNKRDAEIKAALEAAQARETRRQGRSNIVLGILTFLLAALTLLEGNRQLHGKFSLLDQPGAVSYQQKAPQESVVPLNP